MSAPERARSRRRPGENRERLLEAGLIEFGLFGYSGASTAGIAARAEVPQPHVYANFASKRELFLACVVRACETIERALEAPSPVDDASAVGRARAGADAPTGPIDGELVVVALEEPALVVLQACAAVRDADLRPDLAPLLLALRRRAGDLGFAELLTAAADAQLTDSA